MKKKIVHQERENALIIFNPKSGGGLNAEARKKMIVDEAIELGWKGKLIQLTKKHRIDDVIEKAIKEDKIKHVIACGGDGTVGSVAGVAFQKHLSLGIVPSGTGNVIALNLQIPFDLKQAVLTALFGKAVTIDIGKANDYYFCLMAGMGIDAEAMAKTKKEQKSRWGTLAYLMNGFKELSKPGKQYHVKIDKQTLDVRAQAIFVATMGETSGGFTIVPGASPRNNHLRVGIIKAGRWRDWFDLIIHTLRGQVQKSAHYQLYKASTVEIIPHHQAAPFECDGEKFPPTQKLQIEIFPRVLPVLIPTKNMEHQAVAEAKKVIVFDFDGTLADTLKLMFSIYNNVAKELNYPQISHSELESLRGKDASSVLKEIHLDAKTLPSIFLLGRKELETRLAEVKIFPSVREALLKLKKKYALGIVTSSDPEIVRKVLKKNDLEIFDFIDSDRSLFGKGQVLKRMLAAFKLDPRNVYYVGDEVRDIQAAHESGLKIISVAWGFNSKEALAKNNPDFLIDDPKEMMPIFNR